MRGCMGQKGGGSDSGVEGTLVVCSLGVVAEAAQAWHGVGGERKK